MTIRVGFDGWILRANSSGMMMTARSLLDALQASGRTDLEYIVVHPSLRLPRYNRATKVSNLLLDLWYFHVWVPWVVRKQRLDLMHYTGGMASLTAACPSVVTLHDVSFLHYPAAYDLLWLAYARPLIQRAVARAACIITASAASKLAIMQAYGIPGSRIEVIHHGISPRFKPMDREQAQAAVSKHHGLPSEPFVFFIGDLMPRKNLERLIRAFSMFRRVDRGPVHHLVVAGRGDQSQYAQDLKQLVRALGLTHNVHFVGRVPDGEVPLFLNAAALFVYVSLYEGFGLPPLEAMACGVPVVASDVSSMPEILGDAAVLVDPLNEECIAHAMRSIVEDRNLRDDLAARGLSHSARFSWSRTAQETAVVYRNVLGAGGRCGPC